MSSPSAVGAAWAGVRPTRACVTVSSSPVPDMGSDCGHVWWLLHGTVIFFVLDVPSERPIESPFFHLMGSSSCSSLCELLWCLLCCLVS
jgi:hypothetical protein